VTLNEWKKSSFFHVKFVDCLNKESKPEDKCNIDVGFVGFVGFVGDAMVPYEYIVADYAMYSVNYVTEFKSKSNLKLLNDHLSIDFYDGGASIENCLIENILKADYTEHICKNEMKKEFNYNLILRSDVDITVTHLIIRTRSAVYDKSLRIGAYQSYEDKITENDIKYKYNDLEYSKSQTTIQRNDDPQVIFVLPLPKWKKNDEFMHYFEEEYNEEIVVLENWKKGQYFHIKFINCYNHNDKKIIADCFNVNFIGLVGFVGDPMDYFKSYVSDPGFPFVVDPDSPFIEIKPFIDFPEFLLEKEEKIKNQNTSIKIGKSSYYV